jgi:hypothetical protein
MRIFIPFLSYPLIFRVSKINFAYSYGTSKGASFGKKNFSLKYYEGPEKSMEMYRFHTHQFLIFL